MFELKRKYEFHAARKLTKIDTSHPCAKVHGHTFHITVTIHDEINAKTGWVIDFYDIDQIYNQKIHSILDHSYLNDIHGLENPTTEKLAQWIWNNLKNDLKSLHSITVSEGDNYGCTYWGGNA